MARGWTVTLSAATRRRVLAKFNPHKRGRGRLEALLCTADVFDCQPLNVDQPVGPRHRL